MTAIPFMSDPELQPKVTAIRIVEAVIIAVVVAALTSIASSVFTVGALRVEIDSIRESQSELKSEVRELRSVVFRPSWEREAAAIRARPDGVSVGRGEEER